jgi:hypothetical protein
VSFSAAVKAKHSQVIDIMEEAQAGQRKTHLHAVIRAASRRRA